jgi:hypothetical protein
LSMSRATRFRSARQYAVSRRALLSIAYGYGHQVGYSRPSVKSPDSSCRACVRTPPARAFNTSCARFRSRGRVEGAAIDSSPTSATDPLRLESGPT